MFSRQGSRFYLTKAVQRDKGRGKELVDDFTKLSDNVGLFADKWEGAKPKEPSPKVSKVKSSLTR